MRKIIFSIFLLLVFCKTAIAEIKVVTTLSTYADIAKNVGGNLVDVKNIASPKFNPHFIEPRPSDVLKVKKADLFIHSGLDLEAWRGPLLDAAANADVRSGGKKELDLSKRIILLEVPDKPISRADGDIHMFGNPHYWTDPRNGLIIAEDIAKKLIEIDPQNQSTYESNLQGYLQVLKNKIQFWQNALAPFKGQELIGYHNEWIYLIEFAGLKMDKYLEPKPGIPPTPKQILFLKDYIQAKGIKGIVQATYFPKEAAEELSKETKAKILLLCQNVSEIPEVDSYIKMIDYNFNNILEALKQ